MIKIASWNVNSIRSRQEHVTKWLRNQKPDVLLLQELKGSEFPSTPFKLLGYESCAVAQKTYNGVAILSRHPIETVSTSLAGDQADTHARYLEVTIKGIRIVNIYLSQRQSHRKRQVCLQASLDGEAPRANEYLATR